MLRITFLILSITIGAKSLFSQPDHLLNLKEGLNQISSLSTGEIVYTNSTKRLFKDDLDCDTAFLLFADINEPHARFFLKIGITDYVFRDSMLSTIDLYRKQIHQVPCTYEHACASLREKYFPILANKGSSLRKYLQSRLDRVTTHDTIVKTKHLRSFTFQLGRMNSHEDSAKVTYYLNAENNIVGYSSSSSLWGTTHGETSFITSAKYGDSLRSTVDSTIRYELEIAKSYKPVLSEAPRSVTRLLPLGTRAPGIRLTTHEIINPGEHQNARVMILDFWFAVCGPCHDAFPMLKAFNRKYSPKGLQIIGLDPYDSDSTAFARVCQVENFGYQQMMVSPQVADDYKVDAYPTLYVIDKKGTIIYNDVGFSKDKFAQLEKVIQKELDK